MCSASYGKPQKGISFVLVDMKTPGITVRPTRLQDGSFEVNEIWFDNVRVQSRIASVKKMRIRPVRSSYSDTSARISPASVPPGRHYNAARSGAANVTRDGRPLLQDSVFATRIALGGNRFHRA